MLGSALDTTVMVAFFPGEESAFFQFCELDSHCQRLGRLIDTPTSTHTGMARTTKSPFAWQEAK